MDCLGFVYVFQSVGSLFVKTTQRKKGQNLAPQKDTPKESLSLSLCLLNSLSPLSLPLLWKANTTVERRRKRKRRGRRRRRRRPFRFVERRRKSARENSLCVRIQIQTRESKRYIYIYISGNSHFVGDRASDSGAWGHVLCAVRRLFSFAL